MKKQFVSHLALPFARHLELRRSLGYAGRTDELTLQLFDRYLAAHFPQATVITRPIVIGFLESKPSLKLRTIQQRASTLRQFCRFLFQLNPETYIPEKRIVRGELSNFQPHIYNRQEVAALISLAQKLPPSSSLRSRTFVTLIGLLWVTGIRIGEALRLNIGDVDFEQGLLHIHQTKFFKSRLVPLTSSTVDALEQYRTRRAELGFEDYPSAPFFINRRAKRYAVRTIDGTFRDLTRELGMKSESGQEPRLHDFRHSFATRQLERLYACGGDPNVYLPILATYLGHANIASTVVYLHFSRDLLELAGSRFRVHVRSSNGGQDA